MSAGRGASAVIFDCDGVLVDSEETSCGATADLLTGLGFPTTTAEVRERFLGRPITAVYEHHERTTGRPLPASFAAEKEALYIERSRGTLRAMPGAHQLVAALRGRLPIAVATSGSPHKVAFSLAETGLSSFFEVVCTARDVERGKPAPDLFLYAARRLGVEPAGCVVVEDAVPGIEAARAAGMVAVGLTSSVSRPVLVEAGAHWVVDALPEVLHLPPFHDTLGAP